MANANLFPRKLPDGRLALLCEGHLEPGDEYPESEPEPWRSLLLNRAEGCWSFEFRSKAEEFIDFASQLARGDSDITQIKKLHPEFTEYLDSHFDIYCERREIYPHPAKRHLRLEIALTIARGEVNPCCPDEWGVEAYGGLAERAIASLGPLPHWVSADKLPTGGYGLILEEGRRISDVIKMLDPIAGKDPNAARYEPPESVAPRGRKDPLKRKAPTLKKPTRLLH